MNYRASGGGRRAANRRLVIGRHGPVTAEQARRIAHETLGRVAVGEGPAEGRTRSRSVPTLREAFQEFLSVGPERKASTLETYRRTVYMTGKTLTDARARPLYPRAQAWRRPKRSRRGKTSSRKNGSSAR
ncbi:MAG: hypothetical protein OXI64_02690 [Defluviicoccus sp.]|nr:hypothetical protein [Defluviicoccus sp.]